MRLIIDHFARDLPRTIIIIDSSPLLLTNEAPTLVSLAGQIVLVVRANATPRLVLAEALAQLEPSKPIGLVLNGADIAAASYYPGGGAYPTDQDTGTPWRPRLPVVGAPPSPQ